MHVTGGLGEDAPLAPDLGDRLAPDTQRPDSEPLPDRFGNRERLNLTWDYQQDCLWFSWQATEAFFQNIGCLFLCLVSFSVL